MTHRLLKAFAREGYVIVKHVHGCFFTLFCLLGGPEGDLSAEPRRVHDEPDPHGSGGGRRCQPTPADQVLECAGVT
jgi:hypothetical protein